MKRELGENKKALRGTRFTVVVGIFAAISFVLQLIGSLLGLKVGGFLEIEFSDLPPLILSFAYGPLVGIVVEFIKNLLHCAITSTGFVGEFANFVVNGILCLVAGIIYRRKKTFKNAVFALICAVVLMVLSGALINLYIMLPLYMPQTEIGTRMSMVFEMIVPFNIVRGAVLSVITVLLYKRISRVIK